MHRSADVSSAPSATAAGAAAAQDSAADCALTLSRRALVLGAAPAWLAGCAGVPLGTPPNDGAAHGAATPAGPAAPPLSGDHAAAPWHEVALPGKRATRYARSRKDGRTVVHARADASASMWRCHARIPPAELGLLRFSWRVDALNAQASVTDVEREDAVARLVLAFDGDRARLSPRTRAIFDLARSLTGESPPFATLMYVWETAEPVGTAIVNPRTDRIRKLVVDSGPAHLGSWREHRRDVAADYLQVYGEPPGALIGVALMTDSDNTRSRAEAWYGPVVFEPRAALQLGGSLRLA